MSAFFAIHGQITADFGVFKIEKKIGEKNSEKTFLANCILGTTARQEKYLSY